LFVKLVILKFLQTKDYNNVPITSSEIKKYLSGGASNADKGASLGGVISSVVVVDDTLNNLFAASDSTEALEGSTKYRAFFVKNTHATITAVNAEVYISSNTPSVTTAVTIAIADEAVGTDTIETIADEDTAPSGPSFVTADGVSNAISIGDIAPGEMKGIWVKWAIDASTATVNDEMTIAVRLETSA
jgi:hypothetical protein